MAVGFLAPNLYLYQIAYDRSGKMQRELPDAIDLMTISVESGLGFDAAVQQVATNTEGPLADEFARVLREMQIGAEPLRRAARARATAPTSPEVRTFVSAMVQADAFGIPIAQVLRVQSSEIRVKRRQRAEEKAQQVPVKITVPLIFCILPVPVHRGHGTGRHQHHGQLRRMTLSRRCDPGSTTGWRSGARVLAMLILGIRRPGATATSARRSWPGRPRRHLVRSSTAGRRGSRPAVLTLVLAASRLVGADRRRSASADGATAAGRPGRAAVHRRACAAASGAWRWPCRPSWSCAAGRRGAARRRTHRRRRRTDTFTWVLTGIGLGLIASYVHVAAAAADPTRSRPTATPSG